MQSRRASSPPAGRGWSPRAHNNIFALLALVVGVAAHVPPSPRELAHLARLQREHLARAPSTQLSAAPDYSCSEGVTSSSEVWKVTGTSLGGWLVLEPWLTPSLFYQFLGADVKYGPDIEAIKAKTGMDQKSFCTALGPAEANRQLRRHWRLWVTEEHIAGIAATGATHVRIPIYAVKLFAFLYWREYTGQ